MSSLVTVASGGALVPPCLLLLLDIRPQAYASLSLAWWCPGPVEEVVVNGKDALKWTFQWTPPSPDDIGGASLPTEIMEITTVPEAGFSFEQLRATSTGSVVTAPELNQGRGSLTAHAAFVRPIADRRLARLRASRARPDFARSVR